MGIQVHQIHKKFGNFKAVSNVNFEIESGQLAALLGPSGSGKSTILRLIAGLEKPDKGAVVINGRNMTSVSVQNRGIGFVFQHYALFQHKTVEKNISFGLEIRKKSKSEIQQRVAELVDLVKLTGYEKHYPDQLSGGQRQRVALARSLAVEPGVLLLDEPFGALDAKVRANLSHWLKQFHQKLKITTVFVTHDQQEAIEIADKIIVINHGKVEQWGSPREIYEQPANHFVADFIGRANVLNAVVSGNRVIVEGMKGLPELNNPRFSGKGLLLIRPENIQICRADESSLKAGISNIHYRGSHYELDLKFLEYHIKASVQGSQFEISGLSVGSEVNIKITDFRILKADEK